MRKSIPTVILLTLLWSAGSWWWYTCKIKGLCYSNEAKPIAENINTDGELSDNNTLNNESYSNTQQSSLQSKVADGSNLSNKNEKNIKPEERDITFAFKQASTTWPDDIKRYLNALKTWIQENPESRILITGHTDNTGSASNNLVLGLERAMLIKKELVDLGIPATKIEISSRGETMPVADNRTYEGRQLNRRVTISPKYRNK
jgi:outer membrane protein OmpA-like peptidoglycan-associated protein